jgi:hypothetical protein
MATVNTNDPVEVARAKIRSVLANNFPDLDKKDLEFVVDKLTSELVHLIKTAPGSNKKLGASVMTEAASSRNPHTGEHNVPPRIL